PRHHRTGGAVRVAAGARILATAVVDPGGTGHERVLARTDHDRIAGPGRPRHRTAFQHGPGHRVSAGGLWAVPVRSAARCHRRLDGTVRPGDHRCRGPARVRLLRGPPPARVSTRPGALLYKSAPQGSGRFSRAFSTSSGIAGWIQYWSRAMLGASRPKLIA